MTRDVKTSTTDNLAKGKHPFAVTGNLPAPRHKEKET
jgi:hypothetical protein